ncbi:type VI secretion protein [Salmonella enterica subsp. enterica]|uniref:Type VI secretion protein n=1 Tax=Salmonella enterica I TaxID=59201 RepID=A0A379VW96_SALET|nr:type VI secretion protein [Salmonella enterica subsp. enterica]
MPGVKSLVDEVQFLLNAVLIRGAQRIELKEGTYGILNAVVAPSDLADFSTLVLAIKASMPTDVLLQHFAAQTKIGPSDRLPELIRSHLPGLALQVLPVPPRQIPFQAGYIYYDIRREGGIVGTHCPLRRDGHAYRRGISGAGDRTVGSAR